MVTLEALAQKKAMFYVPEAYKKYGAITGAEALKGVKKLHFTMLEPPIVRRTPLPEDKQPINEDGSRKTREDGTPIIYYSDTAYIPIEIDGEQKVLSTGSIDMIRQFYGIDYDELDDPSEDGCLLRFYQDKIDGGLTLRWIPIEVKNGPKKGQKFDSPILGADE